MRPPPTHTSDLSENILLFSRALREKKVGVTTDNVLDALEGLSFIPIERRDDFRNLLRSNFVSSRDQMALFDDLFEKFWSLGPDPVAAAFEEESESCEEKESDALPGPEGDAAPSFQDWAEGRAEDQAAESSKVMAYSPEESVGKRDFSHLRADELEDVRRSVLELSRKIGLTLSRRWKQGRIGDQVDFRRSIRHSLKYGGELVELRTKDPRPKPVRLLLLCDVSGSMDIYSGFVLLFMYGLQNHYPHCNTFVYSTRLSHISSLLRRKSFPEVLDLLSQKVSDWSGGTKIGEALHQFHQGYPDLFASRKNAFLMFSDGWDRGDIDLLTLEMKNLKRQSKSLIWLNPLLGSSNYQPLCKGMAAALPFLDHFLPCHNLASLKRLGRLISRI